MSGHMRGPGRGVPIGRAKMDKVTMNRLLSYLKEYKLRFTVVLFCILVSAVAGVAGSLFLQVVIDDYITPLLKTASPDFAGLFQAVLTMAAIYLIGILATLFYNRTMVSISQGILKKIRDQMFSHMQRLPIRYFDTHTHGDIMSRYTNDTDTLRQMLSMSVPQMFSYLRYAVYQRVSDHSGGSGGILYYEGIQIHCQPQWEVLHQTAGNTGRCEWLY